MRVGTIETITLHSYTIKCYFGFGYKTILVSFLSFTSNNEYIQLLNDIPSLPLRGDALPAGLEKREAAA